jgi:hypothetical protein
MINRARWLTGLAAIVSAPLATAMPITFEFSGTLNEGFTSPELWERGWAPGTAFSGRVSYDTDAEPFGFCCRNSAAFYNGIGPFELHVGDSIFLSSNLTGIGVGNDDAFNNWDAIDFGFREPDIETGVDPALDIVHFGVTMIDFTAQVFDSLALPQDLDLADFGAADFSMITFLQGFEDPFGAGGTVTSLRRVPAPEPHALALMAIALAAVVAARRMKST